MADQIDKENIDHQIQENLKAIRRLRELTPWGSMAMVTFGFLYPLIPGRRSKVTLADTMGYTNAVIVCLIGAFFIYYISYKIAVSRRNRKIIELNEVLTKVPIDSGKTPDLKYKG